jgi:hypothetical protein
MQLVGRLARNEFDDFDLINNDNDDICIDDTI